MTSSGKVARTTDASTANTVIGRLKALIALLPAALGRTTMAGSLSVTVASDQANVANAQLNLSFTHIVSPVTGKAGLRQVDPGNQIVANSSTPITVVTRNTAFNPTAMATFWRTLRSVSRDSAISSAMPDTRPPGRTA